MSSKPISNITFNVGQCPIESVTVYTDRAEVTRTIKAAITQGIQELTILGLSGNADPSSIRVYAEQNYVSILEVTNNTRSVSAEANTLHMQEALSNLQQEKAKLLDREKAILKSRVFLETYAQKISVGGVDKNEKNTETSDLLKDASIRGLYEFVNIYTSKMELYDYDSEFLQKRLKEVEKRIKELEKEGKQVASHRSSTDAPNNSVYDTTVLLQAKSTSEEVTFKFAYLISRCSWSPSFDIRADSTELTKIGLTHYGVIVNNSGDSWNKAKIVLSTLQPSITGAPPTLQPQTVQFSATIPTGKVAKKREKEKERRGSKADETEDDVNMLASESEQQPPSMTFTIPRIASIASDNKPHKVAISMTDLSASFIFSAVPRLQAKAYLKAIVKNNSESQILAGPALIFFDNSFISSTSLKDVGPQEKFEIFLGVDPSVQIEYKPVQKSKDSSSSLSKSQSQTYTHKSIIKNTKRVEVEIVVQDFYPRPVDDKIRVRLLEPSMEEGPNHKVVDNSIEWKLKVPPGNGGELTYTYAVEWPADREIESFLGN